MWMSSKPAALFLLSIFLLTGGLSAQEVQPSVEAPPIETQSPVEIPPSAEPLTSLEASASPEARALLEVFQALPLEGGVALVPRASLNGVRTIEIRGGQAVVNGSAVNREVLRAWLQDSAPPVLELLDRTPAEQRALFGFQPLPAPPVAPAPVAPPVVEVEAESPAVVAERAKKVIHSDARVSVGKRVVIEKNEVAEDVIVIGSSLVIDGEILGDALAVGGPVRVDGRVSGDVASVGGTVYLEDDAQVHGDVVSVGGGIERDEGATVFGELTEVSVGKGLFESEDWFDFDPGSFTPHWPRPFRSVGRFFGGLSKLILLALIACLVLLILPQQTRRAEAVLAREPWKAGVVGLAALLVYWIILVPALVIACLILTITIIGIPVAILLLLAFVVFSVALSLLGYTSAASRLGTWFGERFPGRFENRFVRLLLGILLIEIWLILASLLDVGGWWLFLPVLFLGIFGWLVEFAAWTMGLGAVLTGWYEGRDARAPGALPPTPEGPPHRPLPPLPDLPPEEEPASPDLDRTWDEEPYEDPAYEEPYDEPTEKDPAYEEPVDHDDPQREP